MVNGKRVVRVSYSAKVTTRIVLRINIVLLRICFLLFVVSGESYSFVSISLKKFCVGSGGEKWDVL